MPYALGGAIGSLIVVVAVVIAVVIIIHLAVKKGKKSSVKMDNYQTATYYNNIYNGKQSRNQRLRLIQECLRQFVQ